RVADVDPDVQASRYEIARRVLGEAGYERYEISNWARPGRASRHNVLYWCAGDYLGFGAGAHGHLDGRRWWSVRLRRDYIAAVDEGRATEAGAEVVSSEMRPGEALVLGLRLVSGIEIQSFEKRFGGDSLGARAAAIEALLGQGLLVLDAGRLRIASDA